MGVQSILLRFSAVYFFSSVLGFYLFGSSQVSTVCSVSHPPSHRRLLALSGSVYFFLKQESWTLQTCSLTGEGGRTAHGSSS